MDSSAETYESVARRASQYYELAKDEIANVPEDKLLPLNLPAQATARLVWGALPNIRTLVPDIVQEFRKFEPKFIDRVGIYAGALILADAVVDSAFKSLPALQPMAERCMASRQILVDETSLPIKRDLLPADCLAKLQGAVGYGPIGHDLLMLARILAANYDRIKVRTTLTPDEINEAEELGTQFNRAVGEREQALAKQPEVLLNRQRAYTLTVRGYDRLPHYVMFVRQDHGDEDIYAPSPWSGRTGRRKDSSDEPPAPTPPAPQAPAPAPTTTPNPAPIPVGLPGSEPFLPG